jgi:hypothetical protein
MLTWLRRLCCWGESPTKDHVKGAGQVPARQTEADAVGQAAGVADRFQRAFGRALRSLSELRRPLRH